MSSGAADACWGKSSDQGALTLSLSQHLDDAQAVLAHLWDDWLPEAVKLRIATELPVASARSLARLLASWHDVGKATPAFAVQQRELLAPMERAGLHVDQPRYVEANRRRLPHALAGACAVQRWLVAQGWTLPAANALAAIVGGHHGAPPEDLRHPDATLMGDAAWSAARNELLQRMVTRTGAEQALQAARQRPPGVRRPYCSAHSSSWRTGLPATWSSSRTTSWGRQTPGLRCPGSGSACRRRGEQVRST